MRELGKRDLVLVFEFHPFSDSISLFANQVLDFACEQQYRVFVVSTMFCLQLYVESIRALYV